VTTDTSCEWKLDGEPMGLLKVGDSKLVPVSPGNHSIEAATPDGLTTIRPNVEVNQGQKSVDLQLRSQHDLQLQKPAVAAGGNTTPKETARTDAALSQTWTDPDTRLMWTRKDNGSDVDWDQATSYCSRLQVAGHMDWRLPTIEELEGLDDPSISTPVVFDNGTAWNVHVKGNLKLTGWHWSSSQGNAPGKPYQVAWLFHFGLQKPDDSFPLGFDYSMRALCVRYSGP
jgi:hypothetical protein